MKEKEDVLVIDNSILFDLLPYGRFQGLMFTDHLNRILDSAVLMDKEETESRDDRKQLIVYCLIENELGQLFVYRRATDESYKDARLRGVLTFCVGGHMNKEDLVDNTFKLSGADILWRALERELREEVKIDGFIVEKRIIGILNFDGDNVSRHHIGLAIKIRIVGTVRRKGDGDPGEMRSIAQMIELLSDKNETVEAWSKIFFDSCLKGFPKYVFCDT